MPMQTFTSIQPLQRFRSQRYRCCLLLSLFIAIAGCSEKSAKSSPASKSSVKTSSTANKKEKGTLSVAELRKKGATVLCRDRNEKKVIEIIFPKDADDEMVAVLKDPMFDDVEVVGLSETQITDKALEFLKGHKALYMLFLDNTAITDAGLSHLSGLTRLRSLNLGDTKITGAGLKSFYQLRDLMVLNLTGRLKPEAPIKHATKLIYQVLPTTNHAVTNNSLKQMVSIIQRRLDPKKYENITVETAGKNQLEIRIPSTDQKALKGYKHLIARPGSLEFALLANRNDPKHQQIIQQAEKTNAHDVRDANGKIIAGWRKIALASTGKPKNVSEDQFTVTRRIPQKSGVTEFLVIFGKEKERVTGKLLISVSPSFNDSSWPALDFTFNKTGANRFALLTGRHQLLENGTEWRVAILLDGQIHSAPTIRGVISSQGQITGAFTMKEVRELANVLNAGELILQFKKDPKTQQVAPISETVYLIRRTAAETNRLQSQYENELVIWKKKQKFRDQISAADIVALKKKLPYLHILPETLGAMKPPKLIEKQKSAKTPK